MKAAPFKSKLPGVLASLFLVVATMLGGALVNADRASALPPGPFPQCPRVGWDLSCEILIQINADGTVTVLKDPGEGSYDGVEDTLIGVQNNSSFGIKTMDLTGAGAPAVGPFNFDNDGLCQLPAPVGPNLSSDNPTDIFTPGNCNFGPTRYEGPGTGFTNYSAATGCPACIGNTGTVVFTGNQGLPAGGSAYFSLEGKVTAQVGVVIDPSITAQPTTFFPTEGVTFNGVVATFRDPDRAATASEYRATINWGDMTPMTAGIITGGNGQFFVRGIHMYAEEGQYNVTVVITDIDNTANTATAVSRAIVRDAALSAQCAMPPVIPQSYTGPTAKFQDQSSTGTPSDFSATIDWGDSSTSVGVITGGPGNVAYFVSGSHTYTSTGTFTVTTSIVDVGTSKATATCEVTVFAFATGSGASFVIGDLEAGIGNQVYWWGSQWANINQMSGGAPPDAMKGFAGFEDNPLSIPPVCGDNWTTDPGNSTPPPDSVPSVMGVLVSSHVTKSGSVISGDIKQIVIVRNDPGYAPSPGHPGTGTEIAVLCAIQ